MNVPTWIMLLLGGDPNKARYLSHAAKKGRSVWIKRSGRKLVSSGIHNKIFTKSTEAWQCHPPEFELETFVFWCSIQWGSTDPADQSVDNKKTGVNGAAKLQSFWQQS